MITYNNIVSKFEQFCENHFFIKTFSHGSPSDVDLEKFEDYPLLHLVYTGGDYNSPRAKTYNLEVYILSLPPAEADKVQYQKESISDAEQCAEDILADIQNGGNIFAFGYHYDLVNASVTPLEEARSNTLAGCLLDIAISVPYSYDACNAPLTGVEPEGTTTPSFKARGLLRVREEDGTPDVTSVATINVPNDSLTNDGDGEITLNFGTISDGQQSVWTANSTATQNLTGIGAKSLNFGGVLAGSLTFEQELRAGWSMGFNAAATQLSSFPPAIDSQMSISATWDVTAPTGALAVLQFVNPTGCWASLTYTSATITGNGTATEYTISASLGTIYLWQLANTLDLQLLIANNPGTITMEPKTLTVTVNHA